MCGIVGQYSKNGQVDVNDLIKAIQLLSHRGPDSQQTWLAKERQVGLGHARLSVIDLFSGNQPLTNEDNTIHLVVNGEFYGYHSLRVELERKGHFFKTNSDSEILIHLYEEMGVECLTHLRGEFAFILWDSRNNILFAARDRFGIKPLHYSVFKEQIYFASEVKALFAMGVESRWDLNYTLMSMRHGLTPPDSSLFRYVKQIPPGHYLLVNHNTFRMVNYWDINFSHPTKPLSLNDYTQEIKGKLEESVMLRMQADVPVAFYLSGGIDSSLLLSIASKYSSKKLDAFTIAFNEAQYNESDIARETAARCHANFHTVHLDPQLMPDYFVKSIWHSETMIYNGHVMAKYFLSQAVNRAGFKIVITGEGADEFFAGYPHFYLDHVLNHSSLAVKWLSKWLLNYVLRKNKISTGILLPTQKGHHERVQEGLRTLPTWLMMVTEIAQKHAELLSNEFSQLAKESPSLGWLFKGFDIQSQNPIHQSMYLWCKFIFHNYLLTALGDRMEMSHSVEGRMPFLDHHLVERLCDVPMHFLLAKMTSKRLLREIAKDYLPKSVYQRKKHPFLSPPVSLSKKSPMWDFIQTTIRENPSLPALYDSKKLIQLLDKLQKSKKSENVVFDPVIMLVTSVCVMQDQFKLSF